MSGFIRQALAICLATGTMALPPDARADDDHDRAWELHEHGDILGLADIMRAVTVQMPGEIVAVNLVEVDGRWVYRFQVVSSDGHRAVVDIDASAGEVMGSDGAEE
jgi:uncharacterized membrane protein YkoI